MKRKLLACFVIFIFIFSMIPTTKAISSDELITLGSGSYKITVKQSTTVNDIIKVLGQPKLQTPSAFGGYAYSFYTDSNYSNYLYIETTEEGKIISYGSIEPNYKTNNDGYGEPYPNHSSRLIGCFATKDSKIVGGIYYNINATSKQDTQIISEFKEKFTNDPVTYNKSLAMQSITMYNAFSSKLGKNAGLVFNEEVFYKNEQLKEQGSSIRKYLLDINATSKYMYAITSVKENIELSNGLNYLMNPLLLAMYAKDNINKDFANKNIPLFDYDVNKKTLYVGTISKDALEPTKEIALTSDEKTKLEQGRAEYKEAERLLNLESEIYETKPVSNTDPGKLVAGKIKTNPLKGITAYVNAIRVAGGLPKLTYDEYASTLAQYKSTLLSYRWLKLDQEITHSVKQEEVPGVTNEFYNKAMESTSTGYGENVARGSYGTTANQMKNSIKAFLDDSTDVSKNFSHRQKILNEHYSIFGFGMSEQIATNEFKGSQSTSNFLESWPTNGITFMETLESNKFTWTAQFTDKYEVLDTTTVTIKCLNTNETWEFNEEQNTYSKKFNRNLKSNSTSAYQDRIDMYDNTIIPLQGYVYEITIHNLKQLSTGTTTDYTYRSVFECADTTQNSKPTSITINVPNSLEKDTTQNAYRVYQGQEIKLTAILNPASCTYKLIDWKSSNPDIVSVTQNGTIKVNKLESKVVTITASSVNAPSVKTQIQIIPYDPIGAIWEYEKKDDGTILITNYKGNDKNVVIPEEINGVKVTEIISEFKNKTLVSITIPASIKYCLFTINKACTNFEKYIVDANNAVYEAIDGVLIEKVGRLMSYPCGKKDKMYKVPDKVKNINSNAFDSNPYLEEIDFNNVNYIRVNSVKNLSSLKNVTFRDKNASIENMDGFFYVFVNCPKDIIFYGYKSSTAEEYAKKHNYQFVALDSYKKGDVNGDGIVTLADCTKILKHVKKTQYLIGEELQKADINGKDGITLADYTKLLKHIKNKEPLN